MSRADRHIDHANLVFHLAHHDPRFARVRRHPVQHPGRRTHGVGTIEFHTGCRPAHGHRDIPAHDRVAILRLGHRIRKIRKVSRRIIVAGPRDSNVFRDYGIAFLLELFSKDLLQCLEADTDHAKAGADRQRVLRNFISGDVG